MGLIRFRPPLELVETIASQSSKRICIVTNGHLATCPRMVKAADAFVEAGHSVTVVGTGLIDWAAEADADIMRRRGGAWRWRRIDYRRNSAPFTSLKTGLRQRAATAAVDLLGANRVPLHVAYASRDRAFPELARAVAQRPCDLVYGGGNALPAAAVAARRLGVPFALDLEDFHSSNDDDSQDGRRRSALTERIEKQLLADATFLTAGSQDIADAYRAKHGVQATTVNNTFCLSATPPPESAHVNGPLRLYWFSQTIGPGRGIEDVVKALGLAQIAGEVHLRGNPVRGYLDSLLSIARDWAPRAAIIHHPPAFPDEMVGLASGYDIGIAAEVGHNLNRELCLPNKVLTYLVAGLALALTDTAGQRRVLPEVGEGAIVYAPGDCRRLAAGLARWSADRALLAAAKEAALKAARNRWNWNHPLEKGALVECVRKVFDG